MIEAQPFALWPKLKPKAQRLAVLARFQYLTLNFFAPFVGENDRDRLSIHTACRHVGPDYDRRRLEIGLIDRDPCHSHIPSNRSRRGYHRIDGG